MQIKTSEGCVSEDPIVIEHTISNYFRLSFEDPIGRYYHSILEELTSLLIPKLTTQQLDLLNKPITSKEIESTVFQLGPHKAPRPNGIPTFLYQEF